jgi:hypothetical protein
MVDRAAREFMRRFATDDVRSTVRWLVTNGYELARSEFGANDWSGLLVFRGGAEVHIGLERSQWFMRIAPGPEDPPIDYDLLAVAQRGQAYWDVIPRAGGKPAAPPGQPPPGLSWHDTLPDVLAWIAGHEVSQAVALVQDQRYAVMWPGSSKARRLRRTWLAEGRPTPGPA